SIQLQALGLRLRPVACDDYFINREEYPVDEDGNVDFESIRCVDTELLNKDLTALMNGEKVELPTYNFLTGEREYKGNTLQIAKDEVIVLEGIHCLNEELTYSIPREKKFKIYISALMSLNIDEHNYIPTTDVRLLRRIVRDARTRGYSAKNTIARWDSVRRGEEKNIFPYQESADVMMNSSLIYELAVIKPYAEPLLFGVDRDSDEYQEAKRLLKFLDYILTIPSEDVPANSLVREFIGGGCFDV
ncbi:MAG: nucleoside kinase, partial [Lachnospiraceae bacterium]|nr:nucleoside kinase [Lachnospiraceae bacterium]